ncbi:universal stress protein [Streptomyces antarcticus]|uniref:universal stress protein n=1 Tax=Streptomyces antarcticus TaxID=2996458 RepID=UPI00226F1758|nr:MULTISPECIES: universal stress protein [unclassified Streptomyces]MCY0939830.1 universal stress protein [Streptomyces sp. H34-AA3]MCZ4081000.1 universal stress protein [Streptomyces sp. H34-S5]
MANLVTAGLDGSRESVAAARWAACEAGLRGVPLALVHVEEWLERPPLTVATTEVQRQWAEGLLREASAEIKRLYPDLEVTSRRLSGIPATALAHAAASSDMLVLGSRGLGSIAGFFLGSVGADTVAAADQPVVLVREPHDPATPDKELGTDGPIVMGVDTGRPCDALLAFAFDEASRRGCVLKVLHGWAPPPVIDYGSVLSFGAQEDIGRGMVTAVDDMIRPWREKYPSVEVAPEVRIGQPAIQMVDASRHAALVVVGRRIRRSAYGTHIGAITHAVLHHAAAPVAVIAHE